MSTDAYKEEVIGYQNAVHVHSQYSNMHCPLDCKMTKVDKSDFELQPDGTIKIIGSLNAKVTYEN